MFKTSVKWSIKHLKAKYICISPACFRRQVSVSVCRTITCDVGKRILRINLAYSSSQFVLKNLCIRLQISRALATFTLIWVRVRSLRFGLRLVQASPTYEWSSRGKDLHGKFSAGNTTGMGIKLATIPQDGNVIAENPAVAVGRIVSRLREVASYRYFS